MWWCWCQHPYLFPQGEEEVVVAVAVAVVVVVVVAEDACIREPQSIRGILLRDIQSTKRPKKTKRINSRPKTKPKRKSTSSVPAWRAQLAEQPKVSLTHSLTHSPTHSPTHSLLTHPKA